MVSQGEVFMRRFGFFAVALAAVCLFGAAAQAAVVAKINIGSQRMHVYVNGAMVHSWPVSTARRGKVTPVGTFRPQSLKRRHYSTLYGGAPMPYSIFFRGNYAIHGTTEVHRLGRAASAGCIRLAPGNAAQLFSLVQRHGRGNTRIVITR
jgi:lipoprotein-anchoring transpeptidase ErfK/SrfK